MLSMNAARHPLAQSMPPISLSTFFKRQLSSGARRCNTVSLCWRLGPVSKYHIDMPVVPPLPLPGQNASTYEREWAMPTACCAQSLLCIADCVECPREGSAASAWAHGGGQRTQGFTDHRKCTAVRRADRAEAPLHEPSRLAHQLWRLPGVCSSTSSPQPQYVERDTPLQSALPSCTLHISMLAVQVDCLRDLQASAPPELEPRLAELCDRAQQYDALSPEARRALVAEVVPLLVGPLQRCAWYPAVSSLPTHLAEGILGTSYAG